MHNKCTAQHSINPINQSHAEFYSVAAQLFLQPAPYPFLGFQFLPGFSSLQLGDKQLPRLCSSHFSYKRRQPASNLHMSDNNHSEV